ncbi:ABC transporter substrate-binding protein [Verrucomicrobiota bacterium]
MLKNLTVIAAAAITIALPFVFRRSESVSSWKSGDPVLVIISPHNEAIRYEFGQAFSKWHKEHFGKPVKVDWRNVGGTTEIMRYLAAEYTAAFRSWWIGSGREWPEGGGAMILDRRFRSDKPPPADEGGDAMVAWETKRALHEAFRAADSPKAFSAKVDLFFGGGTYDHGKAFKQGLTVVPWDPAQPPVGVLATPGGRILVPERMSGETWRTAGFFGTCLSTFGICYNEDRLADLEIGEPPAHWHDLAAPPCFGQLGVADPTKSGSIAKAFEMIIHEQCHHAVREAGYSSGQVEAFEELIGKARLPPGEMPPDVPVAYQAAVERGWVRGLRLVQRIGANARYFTDSASKVPIDVSMGDATAGLAIDFYGRYQAEKSRGPDGRARMVYVTPSGGSSVSADPISLLRGAEHRELAVRFIRFVLAEEGQKLWNYAPGTPGGPEKFALRRLPIRRDFYRSEDREFQAAFERHAKHTVDRLGDPSVDPYELAGQFTYRSRWTGGHFSIHRDLIRAMCLDAGEELRSAWGAILEQGGPGEQPEAVALLERMPVRPAPLTWTSALSIGKEHDRLDYMREWTLFFRQSYAEAEAKVGTTRGERSREP